MYKKKLRAREMRAPVGSGGPTMSSYTIFIKLFILKKFSYPSNSFLLLLSPDRRVDCPARNVDI